MNIIKLFGPPGTGKTTACINKLSQYKKQGIPLPRIAYLTFTRAARAEARRRLEASEDDTPYFATIHSICYRQKGVSYSEIVTNKHLQRFGELCKLQFSTYISWDGTYRTKGDQYYMMAILGAARKQEPHITARQYNLPPEFQKFVHDYDKWKQDEALLDFNDILKDSQPLDIDVAIIDEAQDLSKLQWEAVWALTKLCDEVVLAGDDDQAIYEWAGADVEALLKIEGKKEYLNQSYRIPAPIWELADKHIRRVSQRETKNWIPTHDEGKVKYINSMDNLDFEGEWLILHRNHKFIKDTIDLLYQKGIPFIINGAGYETIYSTRTNIAVRTWTRIQQGKETSKQDVYDMLNYISLRKLTKKQRNYIRNTLARDEQVTIEQFFKADWFDALDKISDKDKSYMRKLIANNMLLKEPQIRLSTIHNAKGEEADNVLVNTSISYITERNIVNNIDSELRVWYVALTRARKNLVIFGKIPV